MTDNGRNKDYPKTKMYCGNKEQNKQINKKLTTLQYSCQTII